MATCLRDRRIQTCTDSFAVTCPYSTGGGPTRQRLRLYFSQFRGRPRRHRVRTLRLPVALSSDYLGLSCAGDCQTDVNCLQFNQLGKRLAMRIWGTWLGLHVRPWIDYGDEKAMLT